MSLQEGTFALNNVGFSLSYLNSLDLGTVSVKRASVKSISIQLTLLEEHSAGDGAATDASVFSSSLAWRAMNLGNKVALMAHVEINGVELELEPLSRNSKAFQARKNGNLQQSPPKIKETTRERDDPTSRSILSSYIEAALASLRLSLNMKDFSVKLCQKSEDQVTTTWVQLRLPSISYQDLDTSRRSQKLPNASGDVQRGFSTHTILEKSVIFQGVSISVGETKLTDDDTDDQDQDAQVSQTSRSPVSTIAVMEGSGQISVRALEMNPSKKETAKTSSATNSQTQVQQTVEARLNQQVKVSVDETSLRQLYIVARGFQKDLVELVDDEGESSCDGDILHDLTTADRVDSDPLDNTIDEMEHYTIEGIMKQYEEARQLAQRHELRGGILLPSNAFEEGDNVGEGDPRTFDVFFDANDKSFHHYASVMKDSILSTDEKFGSDFVHTKIRFHLLGGGIKVSFPNHSHDGLPNVSPDEYILLKFNDLNVVSSLSTNSAEHSIHLSHLEIDDAQIEPSVVIKGDLFHENRVEISNILSFSQVSSISFSGCVWLFKR